jgi:type VI secretion system protein ImpA
MSDNAIPVSALPDNLLTPFSTNNGVGEWLRYDPVYTKIKDARREEDDGMRREVWEAELKHANWQEVERLCIDALQTKTKDLQLIVWLLEARLHSYGLDTFSEDTAILLKFIQAFWQDFYPPKTEDPLQEFRTHIIEAFLRAAGEIVLLKPLNVLSPFFTQLPTLAKCYEADNLEKTAKRGGAAADAYQKALKDGLITMERIRNALSEVSKEKGVEKVSMLEACIKNIKDIETFINDEIGNDGPRFDEFSNHLTELKGLYSLCQKEAVEKTIEEKTPSASLASSEEKPETLENDTKPQTTISDRAGVYQAVRQLSEYLITLEPHSPSPALLGLVGSWENKTLAQILVELQSTQPEIRSLLELLARATNQEKSQPIAANAPSGSADISQLSNLVPR